MKRQTVLFLKENYIFRILKNFMMAGLFAIALLLILVHRIDLGVISGISKSVLYITAPLIHIITLPAQGINLSYKKFSSIINVYEENNRLKKENEELFLLKDQIRAIRAENIILKKLLNHIDIPQYQTYTAHIIAETGSAYANSLILYLGNHAQNIKSGYAVVGPNGMIGRIDIVSGRYARVMLVTDINSKIPVISAQSREHGILIGTNSTELKLMFTPLLTELHKGDMLVTSGVGGGLPANLPIARIKKIGMDSITATPLFRISNIEIVKIIAYDVIPSEQVLKELE